MRKRVLDVVLAIVALPMVALAILFAAIAIRLIDGHGALFIQDRVGRGGRVFKLFKLRTMRPDTPSVASHHAPASAITQLGQFLRRTKLDELPQIVNVLIGTMSFVGPRPCLVSQSELIEERRRLGVDRLTPGISGPGQLSGLDMSSPKRLAEADAAYVGDWSLRDDLGYIIRTALGRGHGDAVVTAEKLRNSPSRLE